MKYIRRSLQSAVWASVAMLPYALLLWGVLAGFAFILNSFFNPGWTAADFNSYNETLLLHVMYFDYSGRFALTHLASFTFGILLAIRATRTGSTFSLTKRITDFGILVCTAFFSLLFWLLNLAENALCPVKGDAISYGRILMFVLCGCAIGRLLLSKRQLWMTVLVSSALLGILLLSLGAPVESHLFVKSSEFRYQNLLGLQFHAPSGIWVYFEELLTLLNPLFDALCCRHPVFILTINPNLGIQVDVLTGIAAALFTFLCCPNDYVISEKKQEGGF